MFKKILLGLLPFILLFLVAGCGSPSAEEVAVALIEEQEKRQYEEAARARDLKRQTDLNSLSARLEINALDTGGYPDFDMCVADPFYLHTGGLYDHDKVPQVKDPFGLGVEYKHTKCKDEYLYIPIKIEGYEYAIVTFVENKENGNADKIPEGWDKEVIEDLKSKKEGQYLIIVK